MRVCATVFFRMRARAPFNGGRRHYLLAALLERNVRTITCDCDSPLSQVLCLCSHMQAVHQESTVCACTRADTSHKNGMCLLPNFSLPDAFSEAREKKKKKKSAGYYHCISEDQHSPQVQTHTGPSTSAQGPVCEIRLSGGLHQPVSNRCRKEATYLRSHTATKLTYPTQLAYTSELA